MLGNSCVELVQTSSMDALGQVNLTGLSSNTRA